MSSRAPNQEPSRTIERLSTGNPELDLVLGGGIPRNSSYVLTGPPGAGKTILAQQLAFTTARNNGDVVYFTNVSEPHSKLVEHISSFDFFDPKLLGVRVNIYNITSQIRDKGFQQTLDFIVDTVRSEKCSLIIIDSFRGLKHVLETAPRDRGAIFDLSARLSIMGCTTMLVGEYSDYEAIVDPEFAIADGIICLNHSISAGQEQRTIRVQKMRGSNYLHGEHSFSINSHGLNVYPRQETLVRAPHYEASDERLSTGLAGLDTMMYGGPIVASNTLIAGSSGVGKTVMALNFLAAGASNNEPGLMVSFQENPAQLRYRAAAFGLVDMFDNDLVRILAISPIELNIDAVAARIRDHVTSFGIRRLVIDSVIEIEQAQLASTRFDGYLASLIGFLRQHEVTTWLTREISEIFGSSLAISSKGLSYIVDNIIFVRYIELNGAIERVITVLKTRGSNHDKALYRLALEDGSMQIGKQYTQLRGLLQGMPVPKSSDGQQL